MFTNKLVVFSTNWNDGAIFTNSTLESKQLKIKKKNNFSLYTFHQKFLFISQKLQWKNSITPYSIIFIKYNFYNRINHSERELILKKTTELMDYFVKSDKLHILMNIYLLYLF